MTTGQILFGILFAILGILNILYGISIYLIHSGSKFYAVWFGIGFLFFILSAFSYFRIFSKIPFPIRIVVAGILLICFVFFIYTQIRILMHFNDRAPDTADYLIVLGAQMLDEGPSVVLKYRLDTAAAFLKEHPDTICIVSGGKGPNETRPEADGMKDYLVDQGIAAGRILTENRSGNTIENIRFSKELLPDHASVAIVTNNFHLYRGMALAEKQGMKTVYGLSAPSNAFYLPNNMLREFVGILKDSLFRNMNPF